MDGLGTVSSFARLLIFLLGSAHAESPKDTGRLWPAGIVPFAIESSVERPELVRSAINQFHEKTNLRFLPRAHEKNYLVFRGSSKQECISAIGMQGGEQEIRLGEDCSRSDVIHEIGHALALEHEHTRKDRDQFVRVLWQNVSVESESRLRNLNSFEDLGAYDFSSIMHYGAFAGSKSPGQLTTLQRNDGSIEPFGISLTLSAGDIQKLLVLYPLPKGERRQ